MIQSLEIFNFKSIKKKHFGLTNLNILMGLNGQGKSSFIQTLLLLRQSDKLITNGELKLNGGDTGLINIGTTKDAFYQYAKNEDLIFVLQFKDTEAYRMNFKYEISSDVFRQDLDQSSDSYLSKNMNQSLFSDNFQYLNAQRIEPKSVNITSAINVINSKNIGKHGQYTAHFIDERANEDVAFDNLIHKDSSTFDSVTNKSITNRTLINQINLWLGEISPGVNVRTTQLSSSDLVLLEFVFKQPNYGNTNRFKPENVGFGISYALHTVTALLASRPGELIIIENPESHIHPRGQAELGKLIALVAQNDVQVVIETHSDHILNGVRVAVKDEIINKDKVKGFYFKKIVEEAQQYSIITDITIDKNGTLSDYPENLLDEWSNQLSKLI